PAQSPSRFPAALVRCLIREGKRKERAMRMIGTLLVAAVPLVGIFGLLWLSDRLRARGETGRVLPITGTDGVHGALGAGAAPVVTRRPGGGWRVEMRVPPARPDLAAALVDVTEEVMGRATGGSRRPSGA